MKRINKLKSIIDEIDQLIQKNVTSSSPEFQAWRTKTERFLISEYGNESYEVSEFQKMHFTLSAWVLGTPQSDFIAACKRGLERAKAILTTYLDELEENEDSEAGINAYSKLKYEFSGIRAVVEEYTDSGFVINFLNGLEQGINFTDKIKIKYYLRELLNWYENNWTNICNDEYVNNLDEHERNKLLIKEIFEGIDDCDFLKNDGVSECNQSYEPIILLSHRSTDKKYGDAIEKLLSSIGIKNNQLIYTSHPLHKIPLDKNIYEYLRESFGRKIFVIVLWSNEYLDSPACLNEMGAMWVTQSDYTNIYVPSFDFTNPKYYQCAVDKNKMGAVLDGSDNCKASIVELKNKLVEMFGLDIDENQWIYSLDQFIEDISN
ncbi:toll/interleukin-1 receptor domain-containing protein [Butyrivibrio fibrisolvens]|uniref:toll/interleukin-1 receptor domain-containing protein n=1 Tax=Butyrivibrio fibrisolvens TaxID=831 RepID=UPI000416CE92|nr:toll/interleukin-1 receptor domain-containing protein [Butyrivibrio fibrisolvens]